MYGENPLNLRPGEESMRSWIKTCSFLFALLLLVALPLLAQTQTNSATRGGIGGVVFDSSGAVMPGITVMVTGPQGEYSLKTDSGGHYELNGVVPGSYRVVVEATGFKKYVSDHNQVVVDHSGNLDVHLSRSRRCKRRRHGLGESLDWRCNRP
jgi:hypothetical protein